ncbi:BQ5605_C018g08678 [Microbotryum silenes-dioicae]|uniref:BQ5605_C018g08678 protein n=1 Tax=Microbotryum silenes-dioicae TaxID=796604 RepID=A0A2X0M0M8_9BASI|nr:BQ5605_C018g08678 [Microbotryum silenes-dioicae]
MRWRLPSVVAVRPSLLAFHQKSPPFLPFPFSSTMRRRPTSHSSFPCTMTAAGSAAWRPEKASPSFATQRRRDT